MQRYDIEETLMEKRAEGEYVKFADHQAALDAVMKEAVLLADTIVRNGRWGEWIKAKAFLNRADVLAWRERQKEQP